jgi:hypothetical protein
MKVKMPVADFYPACRQAEILIWADQNTFPQF